MQSVQQIDLTTFDIPARIVALERSADDMWMVIAGAQVLLMQLGFAFLEGGCVRYKNMQSIMIKVFSNAAISILMTWLIGYAFMFGSNDRYNFIGTDLFAAQGFDQAPYNYAEFIIQAAQGAAANSIVSGGAAERMSIVGYMILSVAFSGWIYPVIIHWGSGNGWLMQMGYLDFAGSGTIHLTGAIGALVTTVMLKPRANRFDPKYDQEFQPSNITYIVLSTLSLYFCWMFFNAGSSLAMSGDNIYILATAGMNTMLSGASGGLTVFLIHYWLNRNAKNKYSLVMICNGNLAGLVAITGPCDNLEAWAAVLTGFIGGIVYVLVAKLLHRLQVDDPVDAVPIHGGCGIVGVIVVGFLNRDHGLVYGFGGRQLGVQILGIVVFSLWSFGFHYVVLLILKQMGLLRVSDDIEKKGIDFTIGGGPAFNYQQINQVEIQELKNQEHHQLNSHLEHQEHSEHGRLHTEAVHEHLHSEAPMISLINK